MEPAYRPDEWRDLFVMIGTAAGALVGLLFVVISLHIERIIDRSDANMRMTVEGARNNTYHLLTVLIEAAIVLAPQPPLLMGAELIAVNLFGLRLPLSIAARYLGQNVTISERGGFPTRLILTIIGAYLLGAAGGAAVALRAEWALYLVALSCMIKIVRTVLTAWMLMFGMFHDAAAPQPAGASAKAKAKA
jgi:modulator of FtsH protease